MEKELSAVVRHLPKKDVGAKLECPVCLSNCPRQQDGWVVFACNHGVCNRCFQHLVDTQVLDCADVRHLPFYIMNGVWERTAWLKLALAESLARAKPALAS